MDTANTYQRVSQQRGTSTRRSRAGNGFRMDDLEPLPDIATVHAKLARMKAVPYREMEFPTPTPTHGMKPLAVKSSVEQALHFLQQFTPKSPEPVFPCVTEPVMVAREVVAEKPSAPATSSRGAVKGALKKFAAAVSNTDNPWLGKTVQVPLAGRGEVIDYRHGFLVVKLTFPKHMVVGTREFEVLD